MRRALLLAAASYSVSRQRGLAAAALTAQEQQVQEQLEQQEEFTVSVAGLNGLATTVLGLSTPVRLSQRVAGHAARWQRTAQPARARCSRQLGRGGGAQVLPLQSPSPATTHATVPRAPPSSVSAI